MTGLPAACFLLGLVALSAGPAAATVWGVKTSADGAELPATLFSFEEAGGPLAVLSTVTLAGNEINVDGLAMAEDETLYGFEIQLSPLTSRLIAIDTATSVATALGPVLTGRDIRGAVITDTGALLVLDAAADRLLEIDVATGTPVDEGIALTLDAAPYAFAGFVDLAETHTGQLLFVNLSELFTLDPATGALALQHEDAVVAPDGLVPGHVGIAWASPAASAGRLIAYDVRSYDDIYAYDPEAAYARTMLHPAIIVAYNAGRGDLATASQTGLGVGDAPAPNLELLGGHPNPFNPRTTIAFSLREAGEARVQLFAASGREVRALTARHFAAGRHAIDWDGRDDQGRALPAGIYLCRVQAAGETAWARLVLLK
jgi:hypothetical protein